MSADRLSLAAWPRASHLTSELLLSSPQMANDTQSTCLASPACLKGHETGRGQCSVTGVLAQRVLSRAVSGTAGVVTLSEHGPGACRPGRTSSSASVWLRDLGKSSGHLSVPGCLTCNMG